MEVMKTILTHLVTRKFYILYKISDNRFQKWKNKWYILCFSMYAQCAAEKLFLNTFKKCLDQCVIKLSEDLNTGL